MALKHRYGVSLLVVFAFANVHASAIAGDHALIEAAKADNRGAVRALLEHVHDVNTPEADGTTALHWAVRTDDLEMVQQLVRAGADVKAANRYGIQPIMLAAANGSAPVLDVLLKAGADVNAALPGDGETTLMTAARTGRADAVKLLLAHGANPNARESTYGETALIWAAAENHSAAVQALIDAGADPNAFSARTHFVSPRSGQSVLPLGDWTPLMYAARQGALAAARTLIDAGADPNMKAPDGSTALVLAIINVHYDLAAMLLEKNADPNGADRTGMTALYAAVDMHTLPWAHGRPRPTESEQLDGLKMVGLLLDKGANPEAALSSPKPQRQHTPGDPGLGAGATALMRATKAGDIALMRQLLDYGADPNARLKNGTTLFMLAAGMGWRGGFDTSRDPGTEAGAIAAMTLCLELGADVNAANADGQTALHGALARGSAVIEFLAAHGANLRVRDKQGRTPLELAVSLQNQNAGADHVGSEVREAAVATLQRLEHGAATNTNQSEQSASSRPQPVAGRAK